MGNQNVTERLTWRLTELPAATGLSLSYWRKVARLGDLPTRKIGAAVVVHDEILRRYLAGAQEGDENESTRTNQ